MSDESSQTPEVTAAEAATAVGGGAEHNAAGSRLTQLEAEVATLKDQLLRALAEQENLRRRAEREVRDANIYAVAKFARDMLSVSDNLRRALELVSAEAKAAADSTLTSVIDGVEMTERELLAAFDRHGVRKIEPVGEKFDPNFHQAMFEVPNPALPNGTVFQVVQAGYVIGDRVLRPAMVGVAKGGPKPGSEEKTAEQPHVDKSV